MSVDTKVYRPIVLNRVIDENAKNIEISFILEHIETKIMSDVRIFKLFGFRFKTLTDDEEFAIVLDIVQLSYEYAAATQVKESEEAGVKFSGFNNGKFTLTIENYEINSAVNNVVVTFKLTDIVTKKREQNKRHYNYRI